jgi:hypothetical protein
LNSYEIQYGRRKEITLTGELQILGHVYSSVFNEPYQSFFDEIPIELQNSLKPVNYLQDMLLQMCARSKEMLDLCIYHQTQAVIVADYLNATGDRNRYLHDAPKLILQDAIGCSLSTEQLDFFDKCKITITSGITYDQYILKSELYRIKQYAASSKLVKGFQLWQAIPLECVKLNDLRQSRRLIG